MKLLLIFYPVNCLFSLHGSFLGNWLFSFHFSAVRLMLVHTIWEPFLSLLLPHIILDACVCTFLKIKNHRIFLFIYVFVYSGLRWAFVALAGLPLVVVNGSRTLLRCVGFSLKRLLLLWSTGSRHAGFSSCGTQAQLPCSILDFPRPGIELVFLALQGRFLTTESPGKPFPYLFIQPLGMFYSVWNIGMRCVFLNFHYGKLQTSQNSD